MSAKIVARWYFEVVKERPIIHLFVCLWGITVGIGAWLQFGGDNEDTRVALALHGLAVFMVSAYGWILLALVVRVAKGAWADHCERQIASLDQSIAARLLGNSSRRS